jgi:hypothetical protein
MIRRPHLLSGHAASVDLWTAALRRRGWAQPAIVAIADRVFAIVTDTDRLSGAWTSSSSAPRPPPEPAGHLGLATVGGRGVSRTREPRGDRRGHARRSRGRPHSLPRRGRGDSAIAERPRNHNCCGRGLLGSAGRVARGARAGRRLAPGSTRGPRRRSHDGGERSAYALGLARPPRLPPAAPRRLLGVHVNTIRYRMDRIAPAACCRPRRPRDPPRAATRPPRSTNCHGLVHASLRKCRCLQACLEPTGERGCT